MKAAAALFILIALLAPASVSAQEGTDCPTLPAGIDAAIAALEGAKVLDGAEQLAAVVQAKADLAALTSQCAGLDLAGSAETVYDPVTVPAGLYRVTATTGEFFVLKGIVLDGMCGERDAGGDFMLFNLYAPAGPSQAVLKSEGCEVLWETSNVRGDYAVTFERLK